MKTERRVRNKFFTVKKKKHQWLIIDKPDMFSPERKTLFVTDLKQLKPFKNKGVAQESMTYGHNTFNLPHPCF